MTTERPQSRQLAPLWKSFVLLIGCLLLLPVWALAATSAQLTKTVRMEDNIRYTEYIDADGKLTVATDKKYATLAERIEDGKTVEEWYLDAAGRPAARPNGYFRILKAYNEAGRVSRMTYCDADGHPMIIKVGYAAVERSYDERGSLILEMYFDTEGNPTHRVSRQYGNLRQYDEQNRVISLTYVDSRQRPMMTSYGCAEIRYTYDSEGRKNAEYFYDADGNPQMKAHGEYGIRYTYEDEHTTLSTYLDADGNSCAISKGYASVRTVKNDKGTIVREDYLDLNLQPCAAYRGYYSRVLVNGTYQYQDQQGNTVFLLDDFLQDHQTVVLAAMFALCLLTLVSGRRFRWPLLAMYAGFIVYMTLLCRCWAVRTVNLQPLAFLKTVLFSRDKMWEVLDNVFLFIPLGALMKSLTCRKRWLFVAAAFSVVIESVQYFAMLGYCTADDVLCNTAGAILGWGIEALLMKTAAFVKKSRLKSVSA